jgi:hypothetical protein
MLVFNNYFYKKIKSKLYFGDRVAVLNDFFTKTEGVLYAPTVLALSENYSPADVVMLEPFRRHVHRLGSWFLKPIHDCALS